MLPVVMRRVVAGVAVVGLAFLVAACETAPTPTPTTPPEPIATALPGLTATLTPPPTPQATAPRSPTPTFTPGLTVAPAATFPPTAGMTATPTTLALGGPATIRGGVSGGGGRRASESIASQDVVGQPIVGRSASENFLLTSGLLAGIVARAPAESQ
jgi:hypothetical protein